MQRSKAFSTGQKVVWALRVRAEISSQIIRVEAPAWQGAKVQEYRAYSELSQRSQAGCIGVKNVKLFLREPLAPHMHKQNYNTGNELCFFKSLVFVEDLS